MPRRKRKLIDKLRAKAWARELERDKGMALSAIAKQISDLDPASVSSHLYKMRRGEVGPKSYLWLSDSAREVYEAGPHGTPLWRAISEQNFDYQDFRIAWNILHPYRRRHYRGHLVLERDPRLPWFIFIRTLLNYRSLLRSFDLENDFMDDVLSGIKSRLAKIDTPPARDFLARIRKKEEIGERIMDSELIEVVEDGFDIDEQTVLPPFTWFTFSSAELKKELREAFRIEAEAVLERADCERFGLTPAELIDAALEGMR